ncbi:MAG TPA: hypothetical protein VL333_04080 [Candidatus Saccharimonadales bacterium]|nr:hypothetical protein [Candidatus Saccharimonadales bacterium]
MSARAELSTLEASGLVQVAALEPELEYLFRHALVQDAAYSSLLKQDRRTLHRLAAETLITLYPDRTHELAGVIGMHYERAGDLAAAAEYLVIAGEQALERFARKEAVSFFDRAEASFAPDDPRIDLRLRAALGAGKVSWSYRGQDEGIARLERALALGESTGDPKIVGDIYFAIAFLRRMRGETVRSSPELKRAVDRAAEIGAARGDPNAQAIPKAFMAIGMMFSGELRQGAAELEEALEVIAKEADKVSGAILAGLLTIGLSRLGDFTRAEASLVRARGFAAESGDPIGVLDSDIATSALLVERGDIAEGEALATSCAARSEELGAVACAVPANVISGAAHLARNDAAGAQAPLERGEELSRVASMGSFQTLAEGMLGAVRARLGDLVAADVGWKAALERAIATEDRYGEATTLWQRAGARAQASPPDHESALADIDRAAKLFEEMEARPSFARVLRDRARVLRAAGRTDEADGAEQRSKAIATELGLKDFAP